MRAHSATSNKPIRILISSPSDVNEERERARQVVESLRRRYAKRFLLTCVVWEELPLSADISFQEGIDTVLSRDGGVDISVFILWSRLGSPLGSSIRKADGSPYRSGTEREFDLMKAARIEASRRRTAADREVRPAILVYRREDENSFHERLRGKSTEEQEALLAQKKRLESFFEEEFVDLSTGTNRGAFHTYDRPARFSQRLRRHLQKLLDGMAEGLPQEALWDTESQGPPFMGLEAFRLQHADIFFGREEEILEARRALREQARSGCAFLLLCGASGSGKSSLACAGVAPAVLENELDEQVGAWRKLLITPSELAPDLVSSLVAALAAETVLPEILDGVSAERLSESLRRSPQDACVLQIVPALARAARPGSGSARLLLVVDQMEELFTSPAIDAVSRASFLSVVETLAFSGHIWVLGTVRADFYQQLQTEPSLVRMKAGGGQMDVLPPPTDALRRLVEEPAYHAGLRFEQLDDGQTLADHILRDAAAHPELLPLVEDLLRELYESREGNMLTFSAYRSLGNSVEGALAGRAEAAFKALPEAARQSLDTVLQSLVTLGNIGDETDRVESGSSLANDEYLVRQYAKLSDFPEGSPGRQLIDAFVSKRLFTAGRHAESGTATVTVAHESLLRVWPRAVDCAQANREFLRTRAHVIRRLKEGSPLLDGDPLLLAARHHLTRNPAGFAAHVREFIESSVRTADEARVRAETSRLRRQRQIYVSVVAIVAAIASLVWFFSRQRERDAIAGQLVAEAEQYLSQMDYSRAEIATAKALTYRDVPTTRELLLNARGGGVSFVAGSADHWSGARVTVLSRDGTLSLSVVVSQGSAPIVVVASVPEGVERWRVQLPIRAGIPDSMAISERDGTRRWLAVAWPETENAGQEATTFRAAVWSLQNDKPAGELRELLPLDERLGLHEKRIPSMAFHPTKPWLATSGEDTKLCLWDLSSPQPQLIWEKASAHDTAVHGIAFDPTGELLASGGGDYLVKIWPIAQVSRGYPSARHDPRQRVDPIETMAGHVDSIFVVAFSPDSRLLASGGYDGTVRIWDRTLAPSVLTGSRRPPTVGTLSGHQGTVLTVAFSDDGKLLTSGGKDESVRLWDVGEGRTLVTIRPSNGPIRSVSALNFEAGVRIGGEEGWSVWSVTGRRVASRLWNGGATIQALAFDPEGQYIAAGGNDGRVRLWNLKSLSAPRILQPTLAAGETSIYGIAFSADGRWMAAAGELGVIHVWDRLEWTEVDTHGRLAHDGPIWGLCFDPRGRWLASSNTEAGENAEKRIRRWRLSDWSLWDESTVLKNTVYSLSCESTGNWLVSGDSAAGVEVRDTREGMAVKATHTNVTRGEVNVWSVATVGTSQAIFSANSDGRVRRWSPGESVWPGSGRPSILSTSDDDAKVNPTVNSISVSQKHGWVAAGGDGPSVEIYDLDLRKVRSLQGHGGTVWFVAFDLPGAHLAYGGTDRLLRIFNIEEMDRILETDSPEALYEESQRETGLSAEVGQIIRVTRPRP